MGKAATACSRVWKAAEADLPWKCRGSRDNSWICSAGAQRGLWEAERMQDAVEWLRSRGACQGRWGEA